MLGQMVNDARKPFSVNRIDGWQIARVINAGP
jgi:hypothetical protein